MAKEMMIIFVYDTQMLQKEDDDPASAILYFHPSWVSDQQKTALCGQLMGTVHCVKSILAVPKIVSLQSGKFFVKEYGRYLMAVGTDRNIADWLLEHRAKTLSSLISFFHEDIQIMADLYSAKLSTKLYQLFETYLKYLFLGGNIFSYLPSIKLPKSASNVFLEAIQILQCCQQLNYVLGGTLLYHNKVVATQLSSDITKRIVLTDPYRIKCPGDALKTNFDLPLGVQLVQVYISSREYYSLFEESSRCQNIFQFLSNKNLKKLQSKSSISKEPVISQMKRDQSIIFTTLPEEGTDFQIPTEKQQQRQNRPKFLNLKNKTTDFTTNEPKKPIASTPFYGQTSVCSTPMSDLSKVIHSKPLSICLDPSELEKELSPPPKTLTPLNNNESVDKLLKCVPYMDVSVTNLNDSKKYASVFDFREKMQSINKSITMKYYPNEIKEKQDLSEATNQMPTRTKTIADPNYPIIRPDGKIVSHPFYKDYLTKQLELITVEIEPKNNKSSTNNNEQMASFEGFDCSVKDFVKSMTENNNKIPERIVENIEIKNLPKRSKEHRKSLTLPLKSLDSCSNNSESNGASPNRRHSSGVLLTPLMSKLSTFDDRSSGFCSRDTTPSEYANKIFTPTQTNFPSFAFKSNKLKMKGHDNGGLRKCILFVCGQQDMVVTLLLQEEASNNQDVITKLWEICTENLGKLEKQLHHCLETYPNHQNASNPQNDSEVYSYLYLDPEWDTIYRGGPWGSAELGALTYFHRDFKETSNLTEILMRGYDSVIYGYRCAKSEVFYHQATTSNAGLPTPADAMGNVPLKAKRRLERDHSIILL